MDLSRIGPLMGCASSVCFGLSWMISAMLWGDWVLGSNSLSSIGVCGVASAEIVFNLGCGATGILVIFLGLALIDDRNRFFRYGGITSVICGCACVGIAAVNEDYGAIHMAIASIYGAGAAFTIGLTGAGDYNEGYRPFTFLAAALLILCGITSLTCPFGVYEPIAVSCILVWTFIESLIVYLRNVRERVSVDDH